MDTSPHEQRNTRLRLARIQRNWRQQDLADELGTTVVTIKRWERGSQQPSAYFRARLCALFGTSADELGLLPTTGSRSPEYAEETQLWSVPLGRNPFFTGRDRLLEQVHALLTTTLTRGRRPPAYALSGLGGIGKTQVAIEYAYRYREDSQAVFWVEAETPTAMTTGFLRLATVLGIGQESEEDPGKVVAAVLHWLNQHEGWLLIFDNVEDLASLKTFLPSTDRGALLLTTRLQTLGTLAQRIELEPLSREEGSDFLLARTHRQPGGGGSQQEQRAGQEIVVQMGGLPLALEQAGAYIDATQCSFTDYLHLFERVRSRLLEEHEPSSDHPLSVSQTFTLAFEQVEGRNPLAAELLTVCAFLAPEAIPETFFREGAETLGAAFEGIKTDPLAFSEAIKVLLSYSLLQRHSETQTLSIHRLVQVVLRQRMSGSEQERWQQRVLHQLSAVFPEGDQEYWKQCERFLPHVLACMTTMAGRNEDLELASLLQKAADHLYGRVRQYGLAEELYRQTLRIRLRLLGQEHVEVAATLNGLAGLLRMLSRYKEASSLSEQALSIYEQALGLEHPRVANALRCLVDIYDDQGRYDEAERLSERILRIYERTLGLVHPEVARALNSCAIIYWHQGRYDEAETLFKRALRIYEQTLGYEHPHAAAALTNLAALHLEQGQYDEAEALYQRALHAWRQALGPEHPNEAATLSMLADLFCRQGRYDEAEPLYQQALRIREQALGPEHFSLAWVLNGQANLSRDQGHYERARQLYQRALVIRQKHLGPSHTDIADTLHDLAYLHYLQQEAAEAVSLYRRALAMREQVCGPQHPKTEETRNALTQIALEMSQIKAGVAQEDIALEQEISLWCTCGCGRQIVRSKSRGAPKRFFSEACRQRYYRNTLRHKRRMKEV